MINLRLERMFFKTYYTVGRLYVDGTYFCDTLEDRVRDLDRDGDLDEEGEGKIYGQTAIPYGRYRMIIKRSPKFRRDLPRILDVNNFTDILIHAGNISDDTNGCVLVGENKIKGCLVKSRYWESRLMEKLKSYGDQELFINIV
jgi:hypothetical protein